MNVTASARTQSAKDGPERRGKYLLFFLGGESYGVALMNTRKIIGRMPIRPMPESAPHVKGVISLQGIDGIAF